MKAERCNGWTNYATWNVVLWIDNDEGSYTRKNQWIREFSGRINARLAEEIAEDCLGGRKTPDLKADDESIGCRWKDVNWTEIASHWSDEYEQL
jgi:hypothetical protein